MPGGKIDVLVEPDLRGFTQKLGAGLQQASRGVSGLAANLGRGLSLGLVAGTAAAALGLAKVIQLGNTYEQNLHELQAVTGATGAQMEQVGAVAHQLGSDLSLPATSAADAAAAMLALSKSGLTLDESMQAVRGTLQLAAAAQIDAATAAEIQGTALNQFGLEASEAGRVADVLANTANAAAGSITDIGMALKYVGPVARSLEVDISDTAAAIGLLANQGIVGEQAGTSLRGVLASLSAPSNQAAEALRKLGIVAFDQQGKFVGLREVTRQLAEAKRRMTDAQFSAAAATAFGNEGLTVANALANSGAQAFDKMAEAVDRTGGAARLAAAKTKGLGGAMDGLQSQIETFALGIYEAIDGPLEALVRGAAESMDKYGQVVTDGLESAIQAAEQHGPQIVDAIAGLDLWRDAGEVIDNFADTLDPVIDGIAEIAQAMFTAGGAAGILGAGVELTGDAAAGLTAILVPLGQIVGGLASAFGELPPPIQAGILAMAAFRAFQPQLAGFGATVRDKVAAPWRSVREEIRLSQALLTGSTQVMSSQVGQLGLALAAVERRVPAIGRMAEAYRNAASSASTFTANQLRLAQASAGIANQFTGIAGAIGRFEGGLSRLSGAAAGTAAALGSGLRSAIGGLTAALGGPWGIAIGAAVVGLGLLASRQAQAKAAAEQHKQEIRSLAQALRESNGVMTESIQTQRLLDAQSKSLAGTNGNLLQGYQALGVSQDVWTRALLGEQAAIDQVNAAYDGLIQAHTTTQTNPYSGEVSTQQLDREGMAATRAKAAFNQFAGQVGAAEAANRALAAAMGNAAPTILSATENGKRFAEAMGVLADNTSSADQKVRALDQALQALSGEALSAEQAQANLHESTDAVRRAMEGAAAATGGNLANLVGLDGAINTATEAGRRLYESVQRQRQSMADLAVSTRDAALAAGATLPEANAKAVAAAHRARQAFVSQAVQMGLTRQQADLLADHYGLIPENVRTIFSQPGMNKAQLEAILLKARVDAVPNKKVTFTQAITAEAKQRLRDLGYIVRTLPNGHTVVYANTGPAQGAVNGFIRTNSGRVISLEIQTYYGRSGVKMPGGLATQAVGGIIEQYASGGLRKLNPMQAGLAQVVPPNTWRVIGDRAKDDEAYIPINQSTRSLALLEETARRMGYNLLRRYADGGIAAQVRATSTTLTSGAPQVTTVSPAAMRAAMDGMELRFDSDTLARMVNRSNAENARR